MSERFKDKLKTLYKDAQAKGRGALSLNEGTKGTISPMEKAMLAQLEKDKEQQAEKKETLNMNPYKTVGVNLKFQSIYSRLESAKKKYGSSADIYADAMRLTDAFGNTVRAAYNLHKGSDAKNYLDIAQRTLDTEMEKTLLDYKYRGKTAAAMEEALANLGYQSMKQVEANNQQNVIARAAQMGAANLPEEQRLLIDNLSRLAEIGENVYENGGAMSLNWDDAALWQYAMRQPGTEWMGTGSATLQQYQNWANEEAQRIKNGYVLDYDTADKYMEGVPGYVFAREHQGDLTPYMTAAGNISGLIDKLTAKGWDALTAPEQEALYQALENVDVDGASLGRYPLPEMTKEQIAEAMGGLDEATRESLNQQGAQWAEALDNVNGIFSAYAPTKEQQALLDLYRATPEGAQAYVEDAAGTSEEQKAKDNNWMVERREKFAKVPEMPNYASYSEPDEDYRPKDKYIDNVYRVVNGYWIPETVDEAREYLIYTLMDDEEKGIFNALAYTGEFKEAKEYLEYIKYDLNERANQNVAKYVEKDVNSGTWGAIKQSLFSILASLTRPVGALDIYAQEMAQKMGWKTSPIDYNRGQTSGIWADTARETVQKNVDWAVNILGQDVDLFDFLYGTAMSGVDSAAAGAIGGGGWLGGAILGLGAAQSTMMDIKERGGNDRQVILGGTLAGIFETLFEKASIGKFYDEMKHLGRRSGKEALKNVLAQAGINFSEEFFTELADMIADEKIMGELSENQTKYNEYIRLGMSPDEARAQVAGDTAQRLLEAGFGGALMGGAFGLVSNVTSDVATGKMDKSTGAAIKPDTQETLKKIAGTLNGKAKTLADKYQPGKATAQQTGELFRETIKGLSGVYRETLVERVAQDFKKDGISNDAAFAIVEMMAGQQLDSAQVQALARDGKAMDALYKAMGMQNPAAKTAADVKATARTQTAKNAENVLDFAPMPGFEEETEATSAVEQAAQNALQKTAARQAEAQTAQPAKPAAQEAKAEAKTAPAQQPRAEQQESGKMPETLEKAFSSIISKYRNGNILRTDAEDAAAEAIDKLARQTGVKAWSWDEKAKGDFQPMNRTDAAARMQEKYGAVFQEMLEEADRQNQREEAEGRIPADLEEAFAGIIEGVLNGGMDERDAMDRAAEAIDEKAKKKGWKVWDWDKNSQADFPALTRTQESAQMQQEYSAAFQRMLEDAKKTGKVELAPRESVTVPKTEETQETATGEADAAPAAANEEAAAKIQPEEETQQAAQEAQETEAETAQEENGMEAIGEEAAAEESTATETKGNDTLMGGVKEILNDAESGAAEARMEDGSTVPLEEAGLTKDQQQVAQAAADLPQEAQAAMTGAYTPGTNARDYARGFRSLYKQAAAGASPNSMTSLYADTMTQIQRGAAIKAGQKAYEKEQAQAAADTQKTLEKLKKKGAAFQFLADRNQKGSGVYFARVRQGVSDAAKATLMVADKLAKQYGFQVRVFDHMDANGSYETGSNVINVALDAEGNMIGRTLSHELLHYVKEWGKESGEKLQTYILNALKKADGYDFDARKADIMRQYRTENGQQLSDAEAEEEMAAEGMLDVIDTEENLRDLFKETQDKGLMEKIRDWLADAAQKIKQALNDLAWSHPEVRALKDDADYFQRLSDMFRAALNQASENYRMSQRNLYDAAKADPDVQAYVEAMGQAVTLEDAKAEADALITSMYMRAEKKWIEQHPEEYEQGLDKFREALRRFTSGQDKSLFFALNAQGLHVPTQALYPVLAYAGRQMVSAETQAEKAGGGERKELRAGAMDAEYMRAVENEDEETKQRIVDEAAENAMQNSKIRDEDGKLLPVYHGTSETFTEFDMSKGRANMDIQGAFFSPWDDDARGYGENVGKYYLDIKNPASESVGYQALRRFQGQNEAGKKAREYLISQGYDGVNNEDMEYIAFYPEQIKSADPVTYDDKGEVIPPSERFNEGKGDIRYSVRANINTSDKQMEDNKKIVANMKSVKDLQGNEFVKGEDLLDNVSEYYGIKPNQPVIWYNDDIGDVNVTRRGIRDSIWHGIGEDKAAAFAAIKDVIEKGRLVHYEKDWKGRGYDTCVIAAPITINKENGKPMDYIMGIQVKRSGDTQKYYIHEVLLQKNDGSESRSTRTVNTDRNPGGDRPTMNSILESVMKYKGENEGQKNNPMTKESRRASTDDAETQEALDEVTEDPELYAQVAADADIRAAWQLLMRLHRLTTQGGENALIQKGAFEKRLSDIIQKIADKTGTKYGPVKLRNALRKIYQAMEQSQYSPGEILQYARDLMKDVLDASPGVLVEQDETTKEILAGLKRRRFYLTDDQKNEIKNTYGTISTFTNKNFGTLHVVKRDAKTASLEDVWLEDLAHKLPGVFAEDTSPLDMPGILDAWLETTKEKKYAGEFGHNIGAYATDLALNAMLDFYDVPGALKTKADIREGFKERINQQRAEINRLKETARGAVDQARLQYEERYRQRVEKAQERRLETEKKKKLRGQITRDVRAINSLNVRNSDTSHVPQAMQAAALKAVEPFLSGSGVFSGTEMLRLAREYKLLEERKGEIGGFDEDILITIESLPEKLNGRRLAQLTEGELQELADTMGNLRKIIADENEAFLNGRKTTVDALSGRLKADMRAKGQAKQGPIAKAARMFQYLEETPAYFADRVGGVIKDMIGDLFKGETEWADVIDAAIKYKNEMLEKYHVADWINDKKHARFTTQHGDQIELNKQEALTLYAQWKRETTNKLQNGNHLRVGGFMYGKGTKYEGVDTLRPHPLTDSDMRMIKSYLTEEQMAFADEMVKYLSEDMSKLGNEVSMQLYGYNKFSEPYYFPYSTDKRYLPSDLTQNGAEPVKQTKNKGFTKALMQNAATPLIEGNFMDMWGNHVNEMALYKAFAVAQDTMSRVINQRVPGEIRTDSKTGEEFVVTPESNKIEMERALGEEGMKYLTTLFRDISGGVRADERGNIMAKGLSLFKKGAVLGNLSVVLQQPTAYARAMNMMSPIYLNLVSKETANLARNVNEMYQYSGVAKIKKMGRFDTGTGRSAIQLLTEGTEDMNAAQKALAGIDKWAGIGAEKADEWTWGLLWGAVKKETEHTHPELKPGSEAFLRAAGERFNDICRHTQVYDSVLSKSTWMRSSSLMDKSVTSFMAEPTLSLNMLLGAMQKYNQPGGKRKIAWAAGTYAVSSLLVALAKSIATATRRKKDEGRTWLEKYVAESAGNFLDEISPFGIAGMIPYVRDIMSLFEGYDVQRNDMDAWQQLAKGFKALQKYVNGETDSLEDTIQNALGPVANLFGVPFKNMYRDLESIIMQQFGGAGADEPTTARDLKYSVLDNLKIGPFDLWNGGNKAYYERMEQALIAGDNDKYEELRGYLEETKKVKPDAINSGVKNQIKTSCTDGAISEEEAMKLLENNFGMEHDKAWEEVEKWKQQAAHEDDEEYSYSKYREVLDLVKEGGDITAASRKLTENTRTTEKDVQSKIQSQIGEWYRSGELTRQQAEEKLKMYTDVKSKDDLHWMLDKWDYEKDHPDDNYSKYVDVFDAVKNGKPIDAAMQEMTDYGYEEKDVQSQIRSKIKEWYLGGELTRQQAENKLQEYGNVKDKDELYWTMDQYDFEKQNAGKKDAKYERYAAFNEAVETGKDLSATVKKYTDHGVEKSTLASQITSQFKPQYLAMLQAGKKSEASALKNHLLRAYEVLGYDRAKKSKDIDDWIKQEQKKQSQKK
ncbi:MAG: hypothetical protein IKH30_01665 [Clostridia bacterium]|nr:hypothetical protein [Clostridia bacterium]